MNDQPQPRTPKNIVLCSDGTWNTVLKGRGTNVFKLFEALDHAPPSDGQPVQLAYYDDGVGTQRSRLLRLLGGAFGLGLAKNVRDLYTHLVRVYVPGDHIYLFGFSRGAFTVRALSGLVNACGIIRSDAGSDGHDLPRLVKKAYKIYRLRYPGIVTRLTRMLGKQDAAPQPADAFKREHAWRRCCIPPDKCGGSARKYCDRIRMIGVWDTVDAVGFPFKDQADVLNCIFRFKFPDQELSSNVEYGYQALAIDEERKTFRPILWDERESNGLVQQVWFSGVHANVGGGYPKQGLSLVTLLWMMKKAEDHGLRFSEGMLQQVESASNVHDRLYDSRSGLASLYRYGPRDIQVLCARQGARVRIHESVVERVRLKTGGYAPTALSGVTIRREKGYIASPDVVPTLGFVTQDNSVFLRGLNQLGHGGERGWRTARWLSHFVVLNLLLALLLVVAHILAVTATTEAAWNGLATWSVLPPIAIYWLWRLSGCGKPCQAHPKADCRVPDLLFGGGFVLFVLVFVRDYFGRSTDSITQALLALSRHAADTIATSDLGRILFGIGLLSWGLFVLSEYRDCERSRTATKTLFVISTGVLMASVLWIWFTDDPALTERMANSLGNVDTWWWVLVGGGYIGGAYKGKLGLVLTSGTGILVLFCWAPQVLRWLMGPAHHDSEAGLVQDVLVSTGEVLASTRGLWSILLMLLAYGLSGHARDQIRRRSARAWHPSRASTA